MNSNIAIVTQGHIPDFDVQGGLHYVEKLKAFNLSLQHLRNNNPNAYIILTGHGHRPEAADLCDHVYWEATCRPLDCGGLVVGMPAQYVFVDIGIQHALKLGFEKCLKLRTDSVLGIKNFTKYCDEILLKEQKQVLLSQQTCSRSKRIGDCIMYGRTEDLHNIWNAETPVHINEGLQNTAINFANAYGFDGGDWTAFLKNTIAFRDTISLQWADFRWTWNNLINSIGYNVLRQQVLSNKFDFKAHAWGEQWHGFDENGNMIHRYLSDLISEKEWYANNT